MAIIGAGALGAMYADRFAAAGFTTRFVASGERADRLRRDGVVVNGRALTLPVEDADADTPLQPDLLVVALKHAQLPEALPVIGRSCGSHSIVVSVMNGIDSEDLIADALRAAGQEQAASRVLMCMAAGMDAVRDRAEVSYTQIGRLFVGEAHNDPNHPSAIVATVVAALERAGIPAVVPADMRHAVWNKWMLNVGINQWSAVLGARYGVFHRLESARELMRSAMREVVAVAGAAGVALTEDDLEGWFAIVNSLGAEGKTSMLQDVEAGRPTEVEMFAGRVVELGSRYGIPTPVNGVLLHAIRTIEAR